MKERQGNWRLGRSHVDETSRVSRPERNLDASLDPGTMVFQWHRNAADQSKERSDHLESAEGTLPYVEDMIYYRTSFCSDTKKT